MKWLRDLEICKRFVILITAKRSQNVFLFYDIQVTEHRMFQNIIAYQSFKNQESL